MVPLRRIEKCQLVLVLYVLMHANDMRSPHLSPEALCLDRFDSLASEGTLGGYKNRKQISPLNSKINPLEAF